MYTTEWTKCYQDEDARKVGLKNRDDLMIKECSDKGGSITKDFKDCGNWRFSRLCKFNRF
jgi:hypothetical protein